jgi:hypothetical protein
MPKVSIILPKSERRLFVSTDQADAAGERTKFYFDAEKYAVFVLVGGLKHGVRRA